MKQLKRVFSLLLSMVMLLSVCGVFAEAYAANTIVTVNVVGKYDQASARSMLTMINRFRAGSDAWYWNADNKTKTYKTGKLKAYVYDYDLERIAMQRAAEIAVECEDKEIDGVWHHMRPDGTSCLTIFDVSIGEGFKVAENAAFGHRTAKIAFEDWQETNNDYAGQGHRRTMLSKDLTHVGIAHFIMNGIDYWVQSYREGGVNTDNDPGENNSDAVVPVNVLKSKITKLELSANTTDAIVTAVNDTTPMPTVYAHLLTKEHWPDNVDVVLAVSPIWSTTNANIAVPAGNKVKGVNIGQTQLKAECNVAGTKQTITFPVTVNKCNHVFTDASTEILKEETCTANGLARKTCTKCGEVVEEVIPAAHKWLEERVESTCQEAGYTALRCARCQAQTNYQALPLGDHQYVDHIIEAPTCQKEGSKYAVCSVCGQTSTTDPIALPKTDHQYVTISEKQATCTARGEVHQQCTVCKEYRTYTTPIIAHNYEVERTEPTCVEAGKIVKTCSVCGYQPEATVLPKIEHSYRVVRKEATCTAAGEITKTCTFCGHVERETLPETAHNYKVISRTEATYDKAGSIKYQCSTCKDSYTTVLQKKIRSGWFTISGKKYYYKNDVKQTGWQKISNKWYYFNSSGVMLTGWQKVGGKWYYFNSSGVMLTGWQKIGGKWYYFNSSGAMLTGWQKISSKWYYFNSSGAMLTGWQKIGGKWYYFNSGGDMKTGWLKDGGSWYFFNSDGAMLTGSWVISGKTYKFNSSGVCTNP